MTPVTTRQIRIDLTPVTFEIKLHFVAGLSGGRKAICPGLANWGTWQAFHNPQCLEDTCAAHLVLDRHLCHREPTEVAEPAVV